MPRTTTHEFAVQRDFPHQGMQPHADDHLTLTGSQRNMRCLQNTQPCVECREEIARLKKANPGLNHKAAFAKAASMVGCLHTASPDKADRAPSCVAVCCMLQSVRDGLVGCRPQLDQSTWCCAAAQLCLLHCTEAVKAKSKSLLALRMIMLQQSAAGLAEAMSLPNMSQERSAENIAISASCM